PGQCPLVAGTTLCECVTPALTAGIPCKLLCLCSSDLIQLGAQIQAVGSF
ncbi:hypothetical protein M9458_030037, partial [Cirrhinus mrigala]